MPQIAKVAVSAANYAIDKPYDYLLPDGTDAAVGSRVLVPFGRGNRLTEGMILSLERKTPEKALKAVREVLEPEPVCSEREIRLALWMRQRYFCTFYDAIRTILPAGVWYRYRQFWKLADYAGEDALSEKEKPLYALLSRGEQELETLAQAVPDAAALLRQMEKKGLVTSRTEGSRRVGDRVVKLASLAIEPEEAQTRMERKRRTAPRQCDAVDFLTRCAETSVHDLCYFTGVTAAGLRSLEKAGIIALRAREEYRIAPRTAPRAAEPIRLNDEQQAAFLRMLAECRAGEAGVTLLQGVTGSGKTLVYIRLAQELLREGKSVMILVPEIALTPQMMAKFTAYFGENVAMLHSGLQLTERYDQWKRIRRGDVRVVLGTRSAVFAPLPDLGLIIMDEEQEPTYCSENPPRYHTRDVAQFRCAQSGALLLLGSATPTVETMYYAREGRYQVFPLYRRYNEKALPEVFIADLRDELRAGNETAVSESLRSAIEENLARGEQSILFLNRRGSSRMLLCGECGEVPECPRCSVPMTYHSANGRLMCHYCGHSEPAYERCPQCGGIMKHIGTGTQKVEEELHALFPGAKVLRMDTDTVGASHGHEKLLRQFEEEKIPILLGTQMVAKGLDFENVTLVGVLCADASLYIDNYRAPERTFSLLSQVVGRAGRGSKQGRAIIQTFTPENEVIRAAAAQDYDAFYESEIRMRRLRRYPPFADLFSFTVTGADESRVIRAAKALRDALGYAVERREELKPLSIEVLGPAGASVVKVNNRYRYRVFLVGKGCPALRRLVAEYLYAFYQHKENRGLDIFADCNAIQ